jgi:hypothetical protein
MPPATQVRQPRVRGRDDQHVRCPAGFLPALLVRVRLAVRFRDRERRLVQDGHRGLVRGEDVLGGERGEHGLVEPARQQPRVHPGHGLVHPAGRDLLPGQHPDQPRRPLGGHVPVARQQYGRAVQQRPVGDRALAESRRRRRVGERPAVPAGQPGQQDLGDLAEDLDVDDLCPSRLRRVRAVQGAVAGPAFRRRLRGPAVIRVRVAPQALALVTGLPAALAVLAPLPLGLLPLLLLPGLALRLRPDALLRGRRPGVAAVHRQAPLQLRDPQLHPVRAVQRRLQGRCQRRDLLVLRRDDTAQSLRERLRARQTGLIGHEPQACST